MPEGGGNEWTPDKPLADKDDEDDVQREARARARLNYLTNQYTGGEGGGGGGRPPKKRKRLFAGRD